MSVARQLPRWAESLLRSARAREVALAALLGTLAFALVLDFGIVRPTAIDWLFNYHTDPAQYYISLAFYRNSAWHFPLDGMETMLHPAGASFTLADGIPLLGIPTKALTWALPTDFQYFGFWLFICYVLNAVFAKLVLNHLVRSRPLAWVGTAIVTLAPAFVANFRHAHLSSHWLILAAFHALIAAPAVPKRRIWVYSTMSLFIQPYLFVIVNGVLVGAYWIHRKERRDLAVTAMGWVALTLLSAWVLGYFRMPSSTASALPRFHADLVAFFSAMGTSSIVPDTPMGGPFRKQWNGTSATYAYLGLGGFALLAALLARLVEGAVRRPSAPILHPAWKVLGVLSLLMAAYAWTPSPYILGTRHAGLPFLTDLIHPIVLRLRSVSRFAWPLYYYVFFFGLQAADQWISRLSFARAAPIGALLLGGAQFADIGPWLMSRGNLRQFKNPTHVGKVSRSFERAVTKKVRYLVLDPPVSRRSCASVNIPAPHRQWRHGEYYPIALFAARHHLIVNTDFRASARMSDNVLSVVCAYTAQMREAAGHRDNVVVLRVPGKPRKHRRSPNRRHRPKGRHHGKGRKK